MCVGLTERVKVFYSVESIRNVCNECVSNVDMYNVKLLWVVIVKAWWKTAYAIG